MFFGPFAGASCVRPPTPDFWDKGGAYSAIMASRMASM